MHKERAARAAFLQAQEQYRSAAIAAFQNVADTLAALEHDAEALHASAASAEAARVTLDVVRAAEQAYQTAVTGQVQAQRK